MCVSVYNNKSDGANKEGRDVLSSAACWCVDPSDNRHLYTERLGFYTQKNKYIFIFCGRAFMIITSLQLSACLYTLCGFDVCIYLRFHCVNLAFFAFFFSSSSSFYHTFDFSPSIFSDCCKVEADNRLLHTYGELCHYGSGTCWSQPIKSNRLTRITRFHSYRNNKEPDPRFLLAENLNEKYTVTDVIPS